MGRKPDLCNGVSDAHRMPVVPEFLATVQTHDIGALAAPDGCG